MFLRCYYERAIDGTFEILVRHSTLQKKLADEETWRGLNVGLVGLPQVAGDDRVDNA